MKHEEIENPRRQITVKELESLRKNLARKSPRLDGFSADFYQTFKNSVLKILQKLKGKDFFQTHSVRPALPWYQNQTRTKIYRENNIPDKYSYKNSTRILANNMILHQKDYMP